MLRAILIRLVLSGIGIACGLIGFFVLFVGYGNGDVGFWSLMSSFFAAVCFRLHFDTGKGTLETHYTTRFLRNVTHFSFVSGVVCTAAFVWYIFLTIYYKVPSPPISENTLIRAVWAFICGKWSYFLMYYARMYEITIRENPSVVDSRNSA